MSLKSQDFINPYITYIGKITPAQVLLNANLREFEASVRVLSYLNTNGRLSCGQAYEQLKFLSGQLLSIYEDLRENEEEEW